MYNGIPTEVILMKSDEMDSTEILHLLVDGVTRKYSNFEDLAWPEMVNTVASIKEKLFDKNDADNAWRDPFDFMQILSSKLNTRMAIGHVIYERLGNMGVRVSVNKCGPAHKIHAKKIIGLICLKILLITFLLKSEFPDKKFKVNYSSYTKDGATSEVLIL